MRIAIGSDHGGYTMKRTIIDHLIEQGHEANDVGCYGPESCDYPRYGRSVAYAVTCGHADKGIVLCTTGIGISMVANKVHGIRAALCTDTTMAYLTRSHNDANVLALGASIIGENVALDIVNVFLSTPFSNEEKHIRRVSQIEQEEEV